MTAQTISGRVLGTDTRTFTFGARVPRSNIPEVGQFVKTEPLTLRASSQLVTVVGVVYKFEREEDSITRQLSVAESAISDDEIAWQRSRLIPIKVCALSVGYYVANPRDIRYGAVPQPPFSLDAVMMCSDDEVCALTNSPRFLWVMLKARDLIELDSLIVATIESASRVHPDPDAFKQQCCLELARCLSGDPARLDDLLTILDSRRYSDA